MSRMLIVVDMLKDFIRPDGKLFCGPTALEIVPHVLRLVQQARDSGDTIAFLCDAHAEDDLEFKRFPPHAVKDTDGATVIDELNDEGELAESSALEYTIEKIRYSGFYNTILDELIRAHELISDPIDEVTVCGVCTSICVMDTVGGLANRDLQVTVHRNAVADFDPKWHELALERMKMLYGAVIV